MRNHPAPAADAEAVRPADSPVSDDRPTLLGVSHLGLSVVDLDAAITFWTGTMGFEVVVREPSVCFLLHRGASIGLGVTDHGGAVRESFDERRTGLDHVALAVPDLAALHAWSRRFQDLGVEHSSISESDAGAHLNLRGPDGFPVELFVLSPTTAAHLGITRPAVAGTHV